MAKFDGGGVSAVFTANAQFQVLLDGTPLFCRHFNQFADSVLSRTARVSGRIFPAGNAAGISFGIIREQPKVVWVRSFVPKEKKSAWAAIRSAVTQLWAIQSLSPLYNQS